MRSRLFQTHFGERNGLRQKIIAVCALLIAANAVVWIWALVEFRAHPILLGTALIAYGLGLRHAFDADHIAAIDNVTRKLMQEGKRPAMVGFFFSLGHSSVVVGLSIAIAFSASALQPKFEALKEFGGVAGTVASAVCLFAIAVANVFVLTSVWRTFQLVRRGRPLIESEIGLILQNRSLLGRILGRFFSLIQHSWQMYPLGLMFGLGFDTATEIGVLGISATQATQDMPIWYILIFPALFTVAMSLFDTLDSILMMGAYGWAFAKPIRKLYYNMTITFVSVFVAILVGGIEALGVAAGKYGPEGHFWTVIRTLNESFGTLGYVIVAIFAATWAISLIVYRLNRYDEIAA